MTDASYITKIHDRLDKIVEARYGDTDNRIVEYVLEYNIGLPKYGMLLPAGLKVFLPDRPESTKNSTPVIKQVRLWEKPGG